MNSKQKEAQLLILNEIEKSHNLLIDHLRKFCADTGAKAIPLIYIETSIGLLIDGYKKGANDSKEKDRTQTAKEEERLTPNTPLA